MPDPWSVTLAALALLGQAPSFLGNWQKLLSRLRRSTSLSDSEVKESEIELLDVRADWLFHKVVLLDLVMAFSVEHQLPEQIVDYCKSHRPQALGELEVVRKRLNELRQSQGDVQ